MATSRPLSISGRVRMKNVGLHSWSASKMANTSLKGMLSPCLMFSSAGKSREVTLQGGWGGEVMEGNMNKGEGMMGETVWHPMLQPPHAATPTTNTRPHYNPCKAHPYLLMLHDLPLTSRLPRTRPDTYTTACPDAFSALQNARLSGSLPSSHR